MRYREHGAIAIETVLILPVLLLIILYLLQLVFVLLAKEMTYYASYCGARAALVYNPSDYNVEGGGVVGEAACAVLAWISQSVEGSTPLKIPVNGGEEYTIPRSDHVRKQVHVTIKEDLTTDKDELAEALRNEQPLDDFPMVSVTVDFECPLLIPIGGRIFSGLTRDKDSAPRTSNGDTVSDFAEIVARGAEKEAGRGWLYNYITISETCSLGKPYNTVTFPRIPQEDAFIMRGAK